MTKFDEMIRKEGAESVDEWCDYCEFCKKIEDRNFAACCNEFPDMDPEDFPANYPEYIPTFKEWKEVQ